MFVPIQHDFAMSMCTFELLRRKLPSILILFAQIISYRLKQILSSITLRKYKSLDEGLARGVSGHGPSLSSGTVRSWCCRTPRKRIFWCKPGTSLRKLNHHILRRVWKTIKNFQKEQSLFEVAIAQPTADN